MHRLWKWLRLDPESKDSVVICGPLGAGKRSILHHIAVDAKLLSDPSPLNRKTYESKLYPKFVFRIWEHSCAVGMHFKPEWPEYIPAMPLGLILVIDGSDVALFNTIRSGLSKLLASEPVRSCPLLIMINKSDLQDRMPEFVTPEKLRRDLNLTVLEEQGVKCYVHECTSNTDVGSRIAMVKSAS